MPEKSIHDFRTQALLAQRLAHEKRDYEDLAGSDPATSKKIQRMKVYLRRGYVTEEEASFFLEIWNGDRMALFATSEKVNEITKLGLQMPKGANVVDYDEPD